jgi:hypothetical protein
MADITIPGMFLTGDHASRPAATTVGSGTLYACSDHTKVYQSDGSSWSDWFTAADASGSGALTLIETVTVTGSDGVITFDSIPNTYNDLVIVGRVRDDAASNVVAQGLQMQVGATTVDSGATSYAWHAYDAGASADTFAVDNSDSKALLARVINANTATAGAFSPVHLEIFDYADSSIFRPYICTVGLANASDSRSGVASGAWLNTASDIDIVTIQGASGGNLKIGSQLRLYGRL